MTDFNVCMVEPVDCGKIAVCWLHTSHHKNCCHVGFRVYPEPSDAGCELLTAFPEQDGWTTVYASQGVPS